MCDKDLLETFSQYIEVGKCCAPLFQQTRKNYKYITEQSSVRIVWKLTEQYSYK